MVGQSKNTVIAVFSAISLILTLLVALYPDEVRALIPTRYESVGQGDYHDTYNEEQTLMSFEKESIADSPHTE